MCGIAGFINTSIASQELDTIAGRMVGALRHRGPDDQGVWHDSIAGLALAHRRLTILDLSSAGHQPMVSESGRFVIVFNGEIYNHLELRAKLEKAQGGMTWQGHSDTETILACCEAWGFAESTGFTPRLAGRSRSRCSIVVYPTRLCTDTTFNLGWNTQVIARILSGDTGI